MELEVNKMFKISIQFASNASILEIFLKIRSSKLLTRVCFTLVVLIGVTNGCAPWKFVMILNSSSRVILGSMCNRVNLGIAGF